MSAAPVSKEPHLIGRDTVSIFLLFIIRIFTNDYQQLMAIQAKAQQTPGSPLRSKAGRTGMASKSRDGKVGIKDMLALDASSVEVRATGFRYGHVADNLCV